MKFSPNRITLALLLAAAVTSAPANADDTDIYFTAGQGLLDQGVRPNILFILDTSGSMDNEDAGSTVTLPTTDITLSEFSSVSNVGKLRISNMKRAVYDFLADPSNQNTVNVGLMRFNRRAAAVTYPLSPLDTNRTALELTLAAMRIGGTNTPIVDSLFEASRYFSGDYVYFGVTRDEQGDNALNDSNREESRASHIDSVVLGDAKLITPLLCVPPLLNAEACSDRRYQYDNLDLKRGQSTLKYKSPITHSCQKNHLVLLTDGEATWNNVESQIVSLVPGLSSASDCKSSGDRQCGEELLSYLANTDIIDDATLPGKQSVTTHVVGFNFSSNWLKDLASAGGGVYKEAQSAADLTAVLRDIATEVTDSSSSLVAPVTTVNLFNSHTHRNELFYAVFKPSTSQRWNGNVKKYDLKTIGSEINVVVDKNGKRAVDATSGFFAADSVDILDDNPATPYTEYKTSDGGVALHLSHPRNVYTNASNLALTHADNQVHENNHASNGGQLSNTDMGASTDDQAISMLKWARGMDTEDWDADSSTTDIRNSIGAPLHSKPIIVTYGGTEASPIVSMYVGTNDGFFHAFDARTGNELWAFMPHELLTNIDGLQADNTGKRIYGVDGPTEIWTNDVDNDGIIESTDGDFVYAYFGLRRGGNSYYALDVTNRNSPKLLWKISRGDSGFTELGQTWAKPIKTVINLNGQAKHVLLFSGGYDPDQDDADTLTADDQGRAIYMVDAQTGTLIDKVDASNHADMNYSIPATMAVADASRSSYATHIYVGDMGGQIWRFDINNAATTGSDVLSGQVVAKLSGSDTLIGQAYELINGTAPSLTRKFYATPDLGMIKSGSTTYMAVAIGSGWRANPTDTIVNDRMYMLRIPNPKSALGSFTALGNNDLYNASTDVIGIQEDIIADPDSTTAEIQAAQSAIIAAEASINAKSGWYIDMVQGAGEKVTSKPLILNGEVAWASYEPKFDLVGCQPTLGIARGYSVSLTNAAKTYKTRFQTLKSGGIIDQVALIVTGDDISTTNKIEEGGSSLYMGSEKFGEDENRNQVKRSFWYEK